MINIERLQVVSARLSDVVVDPAGWRDLLDDVAAATGAMGAVLIPSIKAEGAQTSASLEDCLEAYIREGWAEGNRDTRQHATYLQKQGKVSLDRDLITGDNHQAPFFTEFLPRFDGKWWAGVGFWSGPGFWTLTLHRSPRQEPFEEEERATLQQFSRRLNEVGALAYLAGRASMSTAVDLFDQAGTAVLAIDGAGRLIHANSAAERLLQASLRSISGQLLFVDQDAAKKFDQIVDRLRHTTEGKALCQEPIIVRRQNAAPLVVKILPVDGEANSPLLSARALLLLKEIDRPAMPDWKILSQAMGFTPAEARLAAQLATGQSLESSALALGITKETARSRLKSIFQKSDTHRQSELVALLTSLA